MANTHAIKERIKGVESIRQITKSMKMVAASKLRRTQEARGSLELMAVKSREMLEELADSDLETENPFLKERKEIRRVCLVLFVGNRGLCGVYNSSLLRYFEEKLAAAAGGFAVVCGSWGQDVIEASGMNVKRRFSKLGDVPSAAEAREVADYLKGLYLDGEADEIILVYQKYKSVLQQQPGMTVLLPVRPEKSLGDEENQEAQMTANYSFEPDVETIVEALVQLYISNTIFSVMLEARTGEHAARMTSMTSASDSTEELIEELRLELNHARQAAITTEISEIVGGASALEGRK